MKITSRGSEVEIEGGTEDVAALEDKLNRMIQFIEKYGRMNHKTAEDLLDDTDPFDLKMPLPGDDVITFGPNGNMVKAKRGDNKKWWS